MTDDTSDIEALKAEIGALKAEVVAYLSLWATRFQKMHRMKGLHPAHYDRLRELGARMNDFKRVNMDGG